MALDRLDGDQVGRRLEQGGHPVGEDLHFGDEVLRVDGCRGIFSTGMIGKDDVGQARPEPHTEGLPSLPGDFGPLLKPYVPIRRHRSSGDGLPPLKGSPPVFRSGSCTFNNSPSPAPGTTHIISAGLASSGRLQTLSGETPQRLGFILVHLRDRHHVGDSQEVPGLSSSGSGASAHSPDCGPPCKWRPAHRCQHCLCRTPPPPSGRIFRQPRSKGS